MVKDHIGGHVFPEDPDQEKIGAGGVDLYSLPGGKSVVHPLALSCYESLGLIDIILIREHDAAGDLGQAVDGPGIFLGVDVFQQVRISRYRIAQPQAGSGEKFGDPPKDNKIVVVVGERNGGNLASLWSKFFVGLIYHYRDSILEGAVQDLPHVYSGDSGGGRIVGIAQHQQIQAVVELVAEILYVHLKIVFFLQGIIEGVASFQRNFPFVLGIGGTQDQGFLWVGGLDKKGDQFCRAVAHDDIFKACSGVGADTFPKLGVLPVRIAGNGVYVFGQGIPKKRGDPQRIYIGGKTGDIFLFNMIDLFDFFQVAAVEMVFMFQHDSASLQGFSKSHVVYSSCTAELCSV